VKLDDDMDWRFRLSTVCGLVGLWLTYDCDGLAYHIDVSTEPKGRTVASSAFKMKAELSYFRTGGKSVQLPCATSAAMPMDSPSVGCG
jgi:hypothetical protein